MENKSMVRKLSRSKLSASRRGKLGLFPADLYTEAVKLEEQKAPSVGYMRPLSA